MSAKRYTPEELATILAAHKEWLDDNDKGSRADLSRADLSRADLSGADLSRADLSRADLSGADLSRADLSGADLSGADLSGADLSRADLSGADLSGADLSGADLSRADLSRADLSGAVDWDTYRKEIVPAILTAGGKSLADVLATGCWECHDWSNCPMHAAFGVDNVGEVPAIHRQEAARFVELFDAKALEGWPQWYAEQGKS